MTVELKEIDQAKSLTALSSQRGLEEGGETALQNFKSLGEFVTQSMDRTNKPNDRLLG